MTPSNGDGRIIKRTTYFEGIAMPACYCWPMVAVNLPGFVAIASEEKR